MTPGFEKYRRIIKAKKSAENKESIISKKYSSLGKKSVTKAIVERNVDPNDPDITIFTIKTTRGVIVNRFNHKSFNADFERALESIHGSRTRVGKSINKTIKNGRAR